MKNTPGTDAAKVRCPSCSEMTTYSRDNPYRPFCSKGCQAIDLGAWASEQYRVAPAPDDLQGEMPPESPTEGT